MKGAWSSWTVAPERLASLATIGSRAVGLVATMAPEDPYSPVEFGRATLGLALVVVDPASKDLVRTAVVKGTTVESLANAGSRAWIANGREVSIVSGRAQINVAK